MCRLLLQRGLHSSWIGRHSVTSPFARRRCRQLDPFVTSDAPDTRALTEAPQRQSLPAGGQRSRSRRPSTTEFDKTRGNIRLDDGRVLAAQARMSTPGTRAQPVNCVERWIGRAMAIWVHPVGAWRLRSKRVRLVLLFGYVATGYLVGILSSLYFS